LPYPWACGNPFAPNPGVELPSSATVLLEFPVSVVQGADLAGLQPSGDAVEVEGMIADPPSNSAFFARRRSLVGLTFDAEIHDVISADGTVVDDDVPGPQGHGIPLLHFEPLLSISLGVDIGTLLLGNESRCRGIGHIYVRHGDV